MSGDGENAGVEVAFRPGDRRVSSIEHSPLLLKRGGTTEVVPYENAENKRAARRTERTFGDV